MPRDAALVRSASSMFHAAEPPLPGHFSNEDGRLTLMAYFGLWTAFWILCYYGLVASMGIWIKCLGPSTNDLENNRYWTARTILYVFHSLFVACLAVPAVWILYPAANEVRFASSSHLATCELGPERSLYSEWVEAVALAALAKTAFTAADAVVSVIHGLLRADYVVHHLVFMTIGLITRGHCIVPFNGALLLAMDVSTPFLMTALLLRHRGPAFRQVAGLAGAMFVALFVEFRLVLGAYGAFLLWRHRGLIPGKVPQWQAWLLLLAVAAGTLLQFCWFPFIIRAVGGGCVDYVRRSRATAADPSCQEPLQGGRGADKPDPTAAAKEGSCLSNSNATDYGTNADGVAAVAAKGAAPQGGAESSHEPSRPPERGTREAGG
mmetsp:Transcript_103536/g.322587  ORF Transcript_103536/g.322587 Transcript_103536/m.322587 type:complete len:379 (+) Transcript_103536:71-1207(+)